ncbi:MAG TPA: aminotransferase class III-fold pyridoxal phosphate-dependent enzyme, partial [Gemmatimonadales bacterium]|nr:aminotransferase class III-fold pyridoxal phosphate-dependent enzyme [Gemmatimonadales bacterium]
MDSQTVRQKHKEFLFPCVANYYAEPVVITEAHGSTVKDLDGREYLDFFGGILTAGIGHSHPEFVKRIQDQVARLVHT